MNKKKALILICVLLLPILYIFSQYKTNQSQNTIEMKKVNIDYIDNKNIISIINDSLLKDGVYLLQKENSNNPSYIFFKGKSNMVQNISLKLKSPSLEINGTRLNKSSDEEKLLYEFINYNNYEDVIVTLNINNRITNLDTIIFK